MSTFFAALFIIFKIPKQNYFDGSK